MKSATIEIILGWYELAYYGKRKRLYQAISNLRRGFVFLITFGRIRTKDLEYRREWEM